MFELLAPVFAVAGGLLAGVPIILHMFRRTPAVRMPFSIVRFLVPTLPTTTKRASVEHWPLMLLRILAVILIAMAFARPFQRHTVAKAAEAGNANRVSILLDASASMRRDGLREAVLAELQKVVDDLQPEDTLSILRFSETAQTLLSAAEWQQTEVASRKALIDRVITGYEPDWMPTYTANALLEAADDVAREKGAADFTGDRRVVLITDFQEGSRLDELRSGTWPDSVRLDLRVVKPTTAGNAGLSLVEEERSGSVRVRITNSGDAVKINYSLSAFDAQGAAVGTPIPVTVGGGQRRTISLPDTIEGQPRVVGVELLDEPHPFDNVVDLPIDERGVIRVGHAGSNDANDADAMRYYLQRAVDGIETDPVEVIDLIGPDGVVLPPADDVKLVFVTDTIPEGLVSSLSEFTDKGGTVLLALKSTEMAASVKQLLPENSSFEEATVNDYAMLGQLNFEDSLLAPFADARFADFSSIRFWHYRKLTFDDTLPKSPRVLARFDSGTPAILETTRPSGGKVFVLTAGWHPDDSQWALSTRFPPMIHQLIRMSSPRRSGHQLFDVGQKIDPAALIGTENWTLTMPDGTRRTLSESEAASTPSPAEKSAATETSTSDPSPADTNAETAPADTTTAETSNADSDSKETAATIKLDVPGRWTLTGETADGPKSISLLVTVAASESRTEPLPAGQLQAMGLSADVAAVTPVSDEPNQAKKAAQLDASELESQQKFWRWLLLAGLVCLALESVIASTIEKRHRVEVM